MIPDKCPNCGMERDQNCNVYACGTRAWLEASILYYQFSGACYIIRALNERIDKLETMLHKSKQKESK